MKKHRLHDSLASNRAELLIDIYIYARPIRRSLYLGLLHMLTCQLIRSEWELDPADRKIVLALAREKYRARLASYLAALARRRSEKTALAA